MRTEIITVHTGRHPQVHDLTARCARFVADTGDGLLNVFVPHATAGVAILEMVPVVDREVRLSLLPG